MLVRQMPLPSKLATSTLAIRITGAVSSTWFTASALSRGLNTEGQFEGFCRSSCIWFGLRPQKSMAAIGGSSFAYSANREVGLLGLPAGFFPALRHVPNRRQSRIRTSAPALLWPADWKPLQRTRPQRSACCLHLRPDRLAICRLGPGINAGARPASPWPDG